MEIRAPSPPGLPNLSSRDLSWPQTLPGKSLIRRGGPAVAPGRHLTPFIHFTVAGAAGLSSSV